MPGLLTPYLRETLDNEFAADWQRQRRTAEDILQRLETREGVILADQVGMGKTFVALAVATSRILAKKTPEQVMILVPGRVGDKWVHEWAKFSESLLVDGAEQLRCVHHPIRKGEGLLKELDVAPDRRNHVLVVTYEALTASLGDSFIQLALLYYATRNRTGAATMRDRIARWSTGSSGLIRDSRLTTARVEKLLVSPPEHWRSTWRHVADGHDLGDDPVPRALREIAPELDLGDVWEAVQSLPTNRSANLNARLEVARKRLNDATQTVWKSVLVSAKLRLPLLIVDEAHSLKNNPTRISRLFTALPGEPEDGALDNIFERILLLTATPFELGHTELINVLSRLDAVRTMSPKPAEPLSERLDRLKDALVRAQKTAMQLNESWGRLEAADLSVFDEWTATSEPSAETRARQRQAWRDAQLAVQARTLMNRELRPWVIRHERSGRRHYNYGASILPGNGSESGAGLEIPDDGALPFLLAARAQSVAEGQPGAARPLFAYGIASSYEAFLRLETGDNHLDSDGETDAQERITRVSDPTSSEVQWYRNEIESILDNDDYRAGHPKIAATTERAVDLWFAGHKCLIFCWYIRTTGALLAAIGANLESRVRQAAARSLRTSIELVDDELDRLTNRLLKSDSGSHERIRSRLIDQFLSATGTLVDRHPGEHAERSSDGRRLAEGLADVAIRNLRTHSYLVRYTKLSVDLDADGLWDGITGSNPAGVDLLARWLRFAERLVAATPHERAYVLAALLGEGTHDGDGITGRGARLSSVRRAHGGTRREDRERLIAVFNTPFAPEILIASSVMGEGIDLHHECRHVIHHDLDWNPSRLEQRTGRLDRIGALAERVGADIEVFEPYLGGTHDEKMFKVVKDRAGWFDIVMGRALGGDDQATDAEENRVPLHPRVREALTMDLRSPDVEEHPAK